MMTAYYPGTSMWRASLGQRYHLEKNFNPVTSIFTNVGYFSKLMFIVLSIK